MKAKTEHGKKRKRIQENIDKADKALEEELEKLRQEHDKKRKSLVSELNSLQETEDAHIESQKRIQPEVDRLIISLKTFYSKKVFSDVILHESVEMFHDVVVCRLRMGKS